MVNDDKPGAKQLHVVYASPGTRAAFKNTGKFPDGTVLVKEQYEASTAPMASQLSLQRTMLVSPRSTEGMVAWQ